MKNKITYCIVALAIAFGACSENLMDQVEDEQDLNAVRKTSIEGEYTVFPDGLAAVVIDGTQVWTTRFKLVDDFENIEFAYCADMNTPCYPGARYKVVDADGYFQNGEDTKIIAALTYVMNNYGWLEAENPYGYRQMMQCVIWMIIHGCSVTSVENDENEIIMEAIGHIHDNIDDIKDFYDTGVTMEGTNSAAMKDDSFALYGPYQVAENALLTDVDFELTFDEGGDHAKFVNETGEEITRVQPEEPFYVQVPNDVFGDFAFTATASTTQELWFVNDFKFFIDIHDVEIFPDMHNFQPLFQPVTNPEEWIYFYSCSGSFTIEQPEEPDEPEEPEIETITLTGLNWNNGDGNGNGGGINQFTVNGITLKNNKNFVTPEKFDVLVTKAPGKNDETAIYTVTERAVSKDNGNYVKVYDIKVALYNDDIWKGYGGSITVDNPGGNNPNQQIDLERIF